MTNMNVSELQEDDLRTLFLIVQQNLDESDLKSLVGIMEQNYPEALSSAMDTFSSVSSASSGSKEGMEDSMKENIDQNWEPATDFVESGSSSMKGSKEGCYLYYDSSSAKLKLQYASTPYPNALGFYSSPSIPSFKFRKNFGRAELIGNCASGVQGRKNYYSGWCQFIRAARSDFKAEEQEFGEISGELWIFPRNEDLQGLDVDMYVYDAMASYQTIPLSENVPLRKEILDADAITCLPKHSDVFEEVKQMELNVWLVRANNVGATTRFTISSTPAVDSPSRTPKQIALVDPSPMKNLLSFSEDESIPEPTHGSEETKGCYLLYDHDSGKLKLQYSKTPVRNAIGFYCAGPGHSIRGFKFTKNFGRADLIGNCASGVSGRKNYYSGWCQFIRAARAVNGPLWIYPREMDSHGLDVDMYVYYKEPESQEGSDGVQSKKLVEGQKLNVSMIDAIACLPKHTDFFSEIKTMDLNWWMTEGNNVGATSRFE